MKVTDRRMACDRLPIESVRLALCEWLERHGIDPNDTCVPGYVVRHPMKRQVEFLSYERDANGHVRYDEKAKDAVRVIRHVQLEAPPSPWPDIVATPPTEESS